MSGKTLKTILGGFAEFAMRLVQRSSVGFRAVRTERQMKLIETLSLGGKRDLVLVSCGKEKFLIGTGSEGVQTIVAVSSDEAFR